jgi:hypothetical protein
VVGAEPSGCLQPSRPLGRPRKQPEAAGHEFGF